MAKKGEPVGQTSDKCKVGYQLDRLSISHEGGKEARAEVSLVLPHGSIERRVAYSNSGMVDASFKAVNLFFPDSVPELVDFRLHSEGKGSNVDGICTVKVSFEGTTVEGTGRDSDVVRASTIAYVHAINRLFGNEEKKFEVGGTINI